MNTIRRPLNPTSMAVTSQMPSGRRGPMRADHSIRLTTESVVSRSALSVKGINRDSTPVNYRKKRTPSPHAQRPIMDLTPRRPQLKRLARPPSASPPIKRMSTDRLTDISYMDISDYPLFKDVNCIIRDECQDSPVRSTDNLPTSSPTKLKSTPRRTSFSGSTESLDSGVSSNDSEDEQSVSEPSRPAQFSPPRFLPYGSLEGPSSPTALPRHTSDSALTKLHHSQNRPQFSSTSAINDNNDMPRCSSPEPIRASPMTPSVTPAHHTPQIRGRTSKRPQRRSSLSDKLDSLKTRAKSTMISLKRAVSSEKLHRRSGSQSRNSTPNNSTSTPSQVSGRSPSMKRSKSRTERRRSKSPLRSLVSSMTGSPGRWCSAGLDKSSTDDHVFTRRQFTTIGKLMAIHQDGTQTVLLEKSSDSELPFFVSKSPEKGLIVSGLVPSYPDMYYAGLINVLDEIVEINNEPCSQLCVDQVYKLLQAKNMSTLRVRPNLVRKDTEREH